MTATLRSRRLVSRALAVLVLVLTLPGCALRPPQPEPVADQAARRDRLLALESWDLRGRIAVRAGSDGGQGDLEWRQQGEHTRIRLSGPFGAGAWQLDWDPQSVTVSGRDGTVTRRWTGADATTQFLEEQLGWSFPAVSTRYWLLGLSDPGAAALETRAADGRLAVLEQSGWTVRYERYIEVAGLAMPAKIVLENARARLRVVIDRWRW